MLLSIGASGGSSLKPRGVAGVRLPPPQRSTPRYARAPPGWRAVPALVEEFGLEREDLNIDLGPLGTLLPPATEG